MYSIIVEPDCMGSVAIVRQRKPPATLKYKLQKEKRRRMFLVLVKKRKESLLELHPVQDKPSSTFFEKQLY